MSTKKRQRSKKQNNGKDSAAHNCSAEFELAVVDGNPDAEGQPFVVRFHCADAAVTPPHWHPTDESITIVKGTFLVGTGEKFDESKLMAMNPGNFHVEAKRDEALQKGV